MSHDPNFGFWETGCAKHGIVPPYTCFGCIHEARLRAGAAERQCVVVYDEVADFDGRTYERIREILRRPRKGTFVWMKPVKR